MKGKQMIGFNRNSLVLTILLFFISSSLMIADSFNGVADYQTGAYGYYYAITGGKFPIRNIPNGDNASGGTFRYITDTNLWGAYGLDTWHKDDWFSSNAGIALTLQNGGSTVYDNNGIENGTYGNYYDATAQGLASASTPGLYRGYSMSNNFDWIYAGYFKVEEGGITFDTMIGYFDANSGFNPTASNVSYRMNIWSNVSGNLLPVNTGSFDGDVLSSDRISGTFTTSDTGVDRVFGTDYGSKTDDILRLTYKLDAPVTLNEGVYWFSHDAVLSPEPSFLLLLGFGLFGVGCLKKRYMK